MQCINIQGLKQARGGHWNLGILRGDSGETNKPILGAKPLIFPHISLRIAPSDSQVPVSTLGLFHTLDIYRLPTGSPLPQAHFLNSVGYLPDGTPMNQAGNEVNHPENMQADRHTPGSPLPTCPYVADIGYFCDGTPVATAGNALNHV